MADLIDRQKIKARFEQWLKVKDYSEGELNMLKAVLYEIEVMPSAEAEPVRHGHWIDETFKPTGLVFHPYVCDQCGCHSESNFTYCPDCGAKMDEVE